MTPKYCYTCGGPLKVTQHVCYYDGQTGKPVYYETYQCKNRKWYNLYHYMTDTEAFVMMP